MFLKKVIPCVILALASSAMSGCVMADGGHHRGPSSDWHRHHENRHNDTSWSQHAGPAAPANNASQHMGPPPAPDSADQHMGPPPADSGIHRWHS